MRKSINSQIQRLYDFKGVPILAAGFVTLFIMEKRYALRKRKAPLWERLKTNAYMASLAGIVMRLSLIPVVTRLAALGEKKKIGLTTYLPLPNYLKIMIGFLVLDYGSYRWHKLNHKMPFLWRFHQVHHADLDLDTSTALRFHAGEVLISVLYRGAWALFSGASANLALIHEIVFEFATSFHHTNLKMPKETDSALANIIVTPRMHGIHHSVIKDETDSNYSVILNVWDKLHNTFRMDIRQDEIDIGIPYVREHKRFKELTKMPFQELPEWKLPNGDIPKRD